MFTLTIETGNAAFEDGPGFELARILHDVANALESDDTLTGGGVFDVNGNAVGRFELTAD